MYTESTLPAGCKSAGSSLLLLQQLGTPVRAPPAPVPAGSNHSCRLLSELDIPTPAAREHRTPRTTPSLELSDAVITTADRVHWGCVSQTKHTATQSRMDLLCQKLPKNPGASLDTVQFIPGRRQTQATSEEPVVCRNACEDRQAGRHIYTHTHMHKSACAHMAPCLGTILGNQGTSFATGIWLL